MSVEVGGSSTGCFAGLPNCFGSAPAGGRRQCPLGSMMNNLVGFRSVLSFRASRGGESQMVATTHPVKQPADGGRLAVDSRCTASRSWSEVGKATANHRQSKPKRRHRRAAP